MADIEARPVLNLAYFERIASHIFELWKRIPEYEEASVAVIGGVAVCSYFGDERRNSQDLDFIISIPSAPNSVKALYFKYNIAKDNGVGVDILPPTILHHMPANAVQLRHLPADAVPYISIADLIISKFHACGSRTDEVKMRQDAKDVRDLLLLGTTEQPLRLPDRQRRISDMVTHGAMAEQWWRARLVGL